ncbi:hypothetical protein V6N13_143193 [Hibiscus sabdariffa]
MPLRLAVALFCACATASLFATAGAEDPYRFYSWNVTYGDIYPLGVRQTVLQAHLDRGKKLPFPDGILINGRGPGGASLNVEQGMWNLRSEYWARQYLGQQLYLRVYTDSTSLRDEFPIPKNALLCGRAVGRSTRPL